MDLRELDWNQNYWGRSRLVPKPILGYVQPNAQKLFGMPWLAIDRHPAQQPYEQS